MNASLATDTHPVTTAPIALWRVAEAFMRWLYTLFGNPEDVARQHTLLRDQHKLLRDWLIAGEAMLRHLLLIEAAACAPTHARPHTSRRRERKLLHFSPDSPEKWRVSFRCFIVTDRRLPAGIPASKAAQAGETSNTACRLEAGGPGRFKSAWPLAERYEALLRVFNNPIAYARRLARRLRSTPARAQELLAFPAGAIDKIGSEDVTSLREAAQCIWPPPDST